MCRLSLCFILLSFFGYSTSQELLYPMRRSWTDPYKCSTCQKIYECPTLLKVIEKRPLSSLNYNFYNMLSCGVENFIPKYCCDDKLIHKYLSYSYRPSYYNYDINEMLNNNEQHNDFKENKKPNIIKQTTTKTKLTINDISKRDTFDELIKEVTASNDLKETNRRECGFRRGSRIVGGLDAKDGDYPFMANIGYKLLNSDAPPVYRCGGTLMTSRHVLTAAHCVTFLPTFTYVASIRLGDRQTRKQLFKPEKCTPHENYNRPHMQNDIAIIKFDRKAEFTSSVKPICLPFADSTLSLETMPPESLTIAGWGSTDPDVISLSKTLKFARLTFMSNEDCDRFYKARFNFTISERQMCTVPQEGRDSCGGDSGGPIFYKDGSSSAIIVGLVSFGAKICGDREIPAVYTRVASYQNWILNRISN